MSRHFISAALAALALVVTPAIAQQGAPEMTPEQKAEMDAYMKAGTPGEPHRLLAASAGTYDVKVRSWQDPAAPPMEETGTAVRTVDLEGRVVIERFNSKMMGMPFTGLSLTGFDNVSGKYWATWTHSMSTGLMVSEGTCDEKHNCTFWGSWNDAIKKGPVKSRMTTRRTGAGTEIFEMYAPGRDGKEMKMMEITYTKK